MHDLKEATAKRYQNPEIFEQLAIEYAVGSLHGRARERFEVLMDTHFYLRAIVDAYENKFINLTELLPEHKPSNTVWDNIQTQINSTNSTTVNTSWLASLWNNKAFKQSFSVTAMALILASVLVFNPMTDHDSSAVAYSAIMEFKEGGEPIAVTKIERSDLMLSIDIMKPMKIDDSMELTLWCHPKNGGLPLKMGTVSNSGKTKLRISEEEWENLKDIGMLKVSLEKKAARSNITAPSSKILLKGHLSSIK